jgi:ABC-2 type transport system permease protein
MTAVTVALHELRLRSRDRTVVLLGTLAPFLLASIMGFAFSGTSDDHVTIAFVDLGRAGVQPTSTPTRTFLRVGDEGAARAAVRDGRAASAVVLPDGFATKDEPALVIAHRDHESAAASARSVARQLGDRVAGVATRPAAIKEDAGLEDSSPLGFFGPSMAILFLYFAVGSGARSLLTERRQGTLARLRVAPIAFRDVVAGKIVAIFLTSLASTLALWLATSKLFDASWGSVPGVLALSAATVFAIGGIASLIAAFAKNEAAADAATGMVAFLLALFGGNFFPPGALPDLFEKASRLTPNGSALQAFARLSIDNAGVGAIAPALAVLVVIGIVTGVVGFGRLTARVTDA